MTDKKLLGSIMVALKDCVRVKPGEEVLIVSDMGQTFKISEHFLEGASSLSSNSNLLIMPLKDRDNAEPSIGVCKAMNTADIVFVISQRSLTRTEALKDATLNGARAISSVEIKEETILRAFAVDYEKLKTKTDKAAEAFNKGSRIHVTSKEGTDVEIVLCGRKTKSNNGCCYESGGLFFLPAGLTTTAVLEGSANGTIVIDGSTSAFGVVSGPLKMTVKDGKVVHIEGKDGEKLRKALEQYDDEKVYIIGDMGIGTNPEAELIGIMAEDERIYGSVHVGLGNNAPFGGKNKAKGHIVGNILHPTLEIDGKTVVDNNQLYF